MTRGYIPIPHVCEQNPSCCWLKSHGYLRSAVGDLTYDIPSPSRFHHLISYIPIILLLVLEYQKRV